MKALVFDLDGTLADSTYQHVVAWQRAFASIGVTMAAVEIHRRIGMNGDLLVSALDSARALHLDEVNRGAVKAEHATQFSTLRGEVRLFDGADRLADALDAAGIPWGIATSASLDDVGSLLDAIHADRAGAVITREDESHSKPAPHPIAKAFRKLHVDPHEAGVVGDAVWDMLASREAGSFGIGVLTGGYSAEELTASGAFRVYRDVAELLRRLEEIGIYRG